MGVNKEELTKVNAVEDNAGHWYVIPETLVDQFYDDITTDMVENGEFDTKYSEYRTGGDLNLANLWSDMKFK